MNYNRTLRRSRYYLIAKVVRKFLYMLLLMLLFVLLICNARSILWAEYISASRSLNNPIEWLSKWYEDDIYSIITYTMPIMLWSSSDNEMKSCDVFFDILGDIAGVEIQSFEGILYSQLPLLLSSINYNYKKDLKILLDIHRDAGISRKDSVITINGQNAAKILIIVGSDARMPFPNWKQNLALARKIDKKLKERYPGISRGVRVKEGRYNQHYHTGALLIEIGSVKNTEEEAKRSIEFLGEVLVDILKEAN